jgi:hypothetical protein
VIATLASTTRLGAVFSLLTPLDDEVAEVHIPPGETLPKRPQPFSQGATLG